MTSTWSARCACWPAGKPLFRLCMRHGHFKHDWCWTANSLLKRALYSSCDSVAVHVAALEPAWETLCLLAGSQLLQLAEPVCICMQGDQDSCCRWRWTSARHQGGLGSRDRCGEPDAVAASITHEQNTLGQSQPCHCRQWHRCSSCDIWQKTHGFNIYIARRAMFYYSNACMYNEV